MESWSQKWQNIYFIDRRLLPQADPSEYFNTIMQVNIHDENPQVA